MLLDPSGKKPRRVALMGHEIPIIYRKKLPNNDEGAFVADPPQIFVKSTDRWHINLYHELIHAAWHFSGHSFDMTQKKEEALTRAMEAAATSFFILL